MNISLRSIWKIAAKVGSWLWINRKKITDGDTVDSFKVELYKNNRWQFFLEIKKIERRA